MDPLESYRPASSQGPRRGQGVPRWPIAVVIAVLVVLAGWLIFRGGADEDPVEALGTEKPAAPAAAAPDLEQATAAPEEALPDLDASDEFLRALARTLTSHPDWAAWLTNEDLVRRFAAATVAISQGEIPRAHVGFVARTTGFAPNEGPGGPTLGQRSFQRFDKLMAVVGGLDAKGCAEVYRRIEPLAEVAYRDLGYPNQSFEGTLRAAARKVLDTPRLPAGMPVTPSVKSYRFSDAELEALDSFQKSLLRLGPNHLAVVQEKVREVIAALEVGDGSEDQNEES